MLIFVGFPEHKSGPRAKPQQLPMSLWTNGAVSLDSEMFRKLLLSVGDLVTSWDSQRSMVGIHVPNGEEQLWVRRDKQISSRESQLLKLVR